MNRRELFTRFVTGSTCQPQGAVCGKSLIPNAVMRTHDNQEVRLYDDLIKGKQVMINMMYASCEGVCPMVTSNLIKVHEALRPRMGNDLFMYSISLKPEEDTPDKLKAYADMHNALRPGWTFLTGDAFDVETIRFAMFRWNHIKFDTDINSHTSMMRIINDATNTWTTAAPLASLYTVLQHISWADAPKSLEQRLEENRKLQQKVDEEVKLYGYRKVV